MAIHQYLALRDGQYGNDIVKAGTTFAAEFMGVKREPHVMAKDKNGNDIISDIGKIVRDEDGNAVMVAIDDPTWVKRISAADAAAIDASQPVATDVNYDSMSVTELRAVAATMGVDVTDLKAKDDLLTAIKAVRAPAI